MRRTTLQFSQIRLTLERTFIDTECPDGTTARYISGFSCEKGTVESYGSVDEAGGAVTLSDIVISKEDEEGASVTIASTVLTGGEIQADGRLKPASLDMSNLQLTAEDGGMSLADLKVTELLLPTPEEAASDTPPVDEVVKTAERTAALKAISADPVAPPDIASWAVPSESPEEIAAREALLKRHPVLGIKLGAAERNMGPIYPDTPRLADAEKVYLAELEGLERSVGPEHPDVAAALYRLGRLYQRQRRSMRQRNCHTCSSNTLFDRRNGLSIGGPT